jgi:hypothetical protein
MRTFLFFAAFLLLFDVMFSHSAVYKWKDEKGGLHFTDDYNQIPQKHRASIEKQEGFSGESERKTDSVSSPSQKDEVSTDRFGRGEDYWKERVREWGKQLKASQETIETLRGKYNELTDKVNDSKSSVERSNLRKERDRIKKEMDENREKVNEARFMLEKKIPEEAELFKAKPEWLKP